VSVYSMGLGSEVIRVLVLSLAVGFVGARQQLGDLLLLPEVPPLPRRRFIAGEPATENVVIGQLDVPVALFKVGLGFVLAQDPAAVHDDLEKVLLHIDAQLGFLGLGYRVGLPVLVAVLEGRSD